MVKKTEDTSTNLEDENTGTNQINPLPDEYHQNLAVYLALKADLAFRGYLDDLIHLFHIELGLNVQNILKFMEEDEKRKKKYRHLFPLTRREAAEFLMDVMRDARAVIRDEIDHGRELREKHGNNWRKVHEQEIKEFLTRQKNVNQSYT